jgi:hypothetical protein
MAAAVAMRCEHSPDGGIQWLQVKPWTAWSSKSSSFACIFCRTNFVVGHNHKLKTMLWLLLLLFVWPPVGGGFLLLHPRLQARRANPLNSRRVTMLEYHAYYFQSRAWLHTHHTRRRRYCLMSDTNMLTPVTSIGHKPTLHTHFSIHADTCDIGSTT